MWMEKYSLFRLSSAFRCYFSVTLVVDTGVAGIPRFYLDFHYFLTFGTNVGWFYVHQDGDFTRVPKISVIMSIFPVLEGL